MKKLSSENWSSFSKLKFHVLCLRLLIVGSKAGFWDARFGFSNLPILLQHLKGASSSFITYLGCLALLFPAIDAAALRMRWLCIKTIERTKISSLLMQLLSCEQCDFVEAKAYSCFELRDKSSQCTWFKLFDEREPSQSCGGYSERISGLKSLWA